MAVRWSAVGSAAIVLLHLGRALAGPPYPVADLAPGVTDAGIDTIRAAGTSVVFRRGGVDLWGSDGTAVGTVELRSGPVANLTSHADGAAFTAPSATAPFEDLWFTDATAAGTQMVLTIGGEGTCSVFDGTCTPAAPQLDSFTSVDDLLYFRQQAYGVWRSDGTAAGTYRVGFYAAQVCSIGCFCCVYLGSDLSRFTGVNERLYFANNFSLASQVSIERSDGAMTDTAVPNAFASAMGAAGGRLYFVSPVGAPTTLMVFDGDGARSLGVLGDGLQPAAYLTGAGGLLYFVVAPGTGSAALWRSDGTEAGTFAILNADAADLVAFEGGIAFRNILSGGDQLWRSDGTVVGTTMVSALAPSSLTAVGGTLFFAASDAAGSELWQSDGTPAGTVRAADIVPGPGSSAPADLTAACGRLYFTATTPAAGRELWAVDVDPGACPASEADCATDAQCAYPCSDGHCDAATGCSTTSYACCSAAECDDADACTVDSCDHSTGCGNVLVPGLEAITCVLGASGSEAAQCPAETLSTAIGRRFDRVRTRLAQAAAQTDGQRALKRVAAAVRVLQRVQKRIDRDRARGKIGLACHDALTAVVTTASDRATAWQP